MELTEFGPSNHFAVYKDETSCSKILVELMGFEPTTFPVSPGRADKLLNHCKIFQGLAFALATNGLCARGIIFSVNQLPRSAILQRLGVISLVVGDSCWQVFRLADVKAARGITLQYIEMKRHALKFWWS
jgi:hypothetical protein